MRGEAEDIGAQSGRLWLRGGDGSSVMNEARAIPDHETALRIALGELKKGKYASPSAIGHRVVNGGSRYSTPQKITPQILNDLRNLIPLAPLHLPAEIKIMEAVASEAPQIPQVAAKLQRNERRIIDFCGAKEFSVDGLRRMINEVG